MNTTIIKIETTNYIVELERANNLKDLHTYWVKVTHKRILFPSKSYISLFYPKLHAFKLFLKIAGNIINKKYITYT